MRTRLAMFMLACSAVMAGAARAPVGDAPVAGRSMGWLYEPSSGAATDLRATADGAVVLPAGTENSWASAEAHVGVDLDR